MLRLYIANKNYSSWSLRPWVLMRQLGIEFEEMLVPFGHPGQPSPFHAFSPSGKVPCLADGDTLVWESLAIAEYLAERDARVWPADRLARAWARWRRCRRGTRRRSPRLGATKRTKRKRTAPASCWLIFAAPREPDERHGEAPGADIRSSTSR
jgi:glutathione S-transferase